MMVPLVEVADKLEDQKLSDESENGNEQIEKDNSSQKVDEGKPSNTSKADAQEGDKLKEKKEKNRPSTKILIRRLPPSMNEETFLAQVDPLPDHDYMYFVRADMSLAVNAFSRAYINITNEEDIFTFKEKFDNYIFVDKKGSEYPAVVEFAPYQRLPKKCPRKDIKAGTIEEDPNYLSFLKELEEQNKEKANTHSCDYSYQPADYGSKAETTTPLLEFLKNRRAEKQRIRDERREDRRRKEIERKKIREEEKRKKRPDSSRDGDSKQVLRNPHNEATDASKNTQEGDGKLVGERKRDEEKPKYRSDKKIPENRSRDRHERQGSKSGLKPLDSRSTRKSGEDQRRMGDDDQQHKRSQSGKMADSRRGQDGLGENRKHQLAGSEQRKYEKSHTREREKDKHIPSKDAYYKDNEPRRSFVKESVVRRPPREKKSDSKNTENKEPDKNCVSGVEPKFHVDEWNDDHLTATRDRILNSQVDGHSVTRRFSLEFNDLQNDSIPENGYDAKLLRKSADDLEQLVKESPVTRLSSEEYKKDYNSKLYSTRYVKRTTKQATTPTSNLPTNMATFLEFIEKSNTRNLEQRQENAMSDFQRRNSLESSDIEKGMSLGGIPRSVVMRRNLSLELEPSGWDRAMLSRETSIESSSEDKKDSRKKSEKRNDSKTKKDPREERRIRNKDRPSIEIYRPGMGRFSRQRIEREKEQESSQSPSPTPSNRSTNLQKRQDT